MEVACYHTGLTMEKLMPREPLPPHLKKSKRNEVMSRPGDNDLVYEAIRANLEAGEPSPNNFADYILQAGVAQAKADIRRHKRQTA